MSFADAVKKNLPEGEGGSDEGGSSRNITPPPLSDGKRDDPDEQWITYERTEKGLRHSSLGVGKPVVRSPGKAKAGERSHRDVPVYDRVGEMMKENAPAMPGAQPGRYAGGRNSNLDLRGEVA